MPSGHGHGLSGHGLWHGLLHRLRHGLYVPDVQFVSRKWPRPAAVGAGGSACGTAFIGIAVHCVLRRGERPRSTAVALQYPQAICSKLYFFFSVSILLF